VADTGKDALIEQRIGNLRAAMFSKLRQRSSWTPRVGQHVAREVVALTCIPCLDEPDRCTPDGDVAIDEGHDKPRRSRASIVAGDRPTLHPGREGPPQQEVHTHRERVALKDEMLAPRENVPDGFRAYALDANPTVPRDRSNPPADKGPQLLSREMDGRPFHGSVL